MNKQKKSKVLTIHLPIIAAGSLLLGAIFQWILPVGDFWLGFLASSSLFFLSMMVLYIAWRTSKGSAALGWMMLIAFLLRIALGIFLAWGLPRFGYDEPPQQGGFVFTDAYRREESAWELAQSGQPITASFGDDYGVDQYGGMLAMSALVYRFISPDAFRPALVSILAAFAGALSLPFLVGAIKRRFSDRAVMWSAWILALYPEGILLGSSQMREPFLILFFTMLFWAASRWLERGKLSRILPIGLIGLLGFALFSYRVALPVIAAVLLWTWVVKTANLKRPAIKVIGWVAIIAGFIAAVFLLTGWLGEASRWDSLLTIRASGMVQFQLERLPKWLHLPFIAIYGLFQPVLPAAIAAPAPWIWRSLGIFRALGWYLLLPLLAYTLIRVWGMKDQTKKRWFVIIILLIWAWIFLASIRAGGDQWDNPRYRTIFLPWMAIAASAGVQLALSTEDRWLTRALGVEGIFLGFFTYWYISRYYPVVPKLDFLVMIASIAVLSVVLLLVGWLRDRKTAQDKPSIAGDSSKSKKDQLE